MRSLRPKRFISPIAYHEAFQEGKLAYADSRVCNPYTRLGNDAEFERNLAWSAGFHYALGLAERRMRREK